MISFVGKDRKVTSNATLSFVNKAVKTTSVVKTPGKRVSGKVVWKDNRFQVRIDKNLYELNGWDDLTNVKWIYALPTNTYHIPWHRKPYLPTDPNDKNVIAMTLRFWGKYKHGYTIYGKIVDNVFHPSIPRHESDIPETTESTE